MEKKTLTVREGQEILSRIATHRGEDSALVISYDPGHVTMGPSPVLGIVGIHAGFDWNSGKVFLQTEKPVGIVGDDLNSLREETNKTNELVGWMRLRINDKRLSDEEKVKLFAEAIEDHTKKRKASRQKKVK